MQVRINHNCFENQSQFEDIDAIFSLFKQGQHNWIDMDLEYLKTTNWFNELGKRDISDINKFAVASTRKTKNKKQIHISSYQENENYFNTTEAKIYLKQPLTIFVENSDYETPFVNALVKNYDYSGDLINALNENWLVYENLGGGNNNAIQGKINNNFNNDYLNKNKRSYLRVFVIKDSDREYCIKNQDGSISIPDLPKNKTEFFNHQEEKCKIPIHYWYKREKENYIPDCIYSNYINDSVKGSYAQAFLRLDNHQKDFLDIEKGFSFFNKETKSLMVMSRNELKQEISDLYSKISDEDYYVLGFGFTSKYSNIKSNFTREFNSVNKNDLEKRIQHQPKLTSKVNPEDTTKRNEFEHIIHEIKYLL